MKHTLIIILILSLLIISCKQEKKDALVNKDDTTFELKAQVTNIPDSTLFYLKTTSNITVDSAFVINGNLSLKGKLEAKQPEILTLYCTKPEFIYTQLFVENEHVSFKADKKDFPWNIDVSGSIHQDEAEKFNQILHAKKTLENDLRSRYNSDKNTLSKKVNALSDSLDNVTVNLIKKNFNSYVALRHFLFHKTKFSNEELSSLYNELDKNKKETLAAKAVKLQSQFIFPKVGDTYYDYSATNQNGDTIALSSIKEKYMLLHFSSLACHGSQLALPDLKTLYKTYNSNLEIVSISTDAVKQQWLNHVKRDTIPWQYLWDGKGNYNDAYVKYWENGTPNFVLIAPNKIILDRWFGFRKGMLREKIESYLN